LRLKYGHDQALNALLQFYILFEELNLLALHQGIHANLYKYSSFDISVICEPPKVQKIRKKNNETRK
jgi:hypothetical protein